MRGLVSSLVNIQYTNKDLRQNCKSCYTEVEKVSMKKMSQKNMKWIFLKFFL